MTYFDLTCQLKSSEEEDIIEELTSRKEFYPIERCIDICKKRGLKLPLAYLMNRDGCYEDAIATFMEVIETIKIKCRYINHEDVPMFKQSI